MSRSWLLFIFACDHLCLISLTTFILDREASPENLRNSYINKLILTLPCFSTENVAICTQFLINGLSVWWFSERTWQRNKKEKAEQGRKEWNTAAAGQRGRNNISIYVFLCCKHVSSHQLNDTTLSTLKITWGFFQSLEPRSRSIYDKLDRSASNAAPDQSRAKPKNKVPQNKVSFILYAYLLLYVFVCLFYTPIKELHLMSSSSLHRWSRLFRRSKKTSLSMRTFDVWINPSNTFG